MRQFPDTSELKDHIYNEHSGNPKTPIYPLHKLHCREATFPSSLKLEFHLENVHYVDFKKSLKRSRPAGDGNAGPAKRLSKPKTEDQEYEFIDESDKVWDQRKRPRYPVLL